MWHLQPWSLTECLSNVHENYRPTVEWIFGEILQENEPVYIAAEASRPNLDEIVSTYSCKSCLVVLTSYRWLRATVDCGPASNDYITYYKQLVGLRSWPLPDKTIPHVWVTPPRLIPKKKYNGRTKLYENIAPYFTEMLLQSLAQVSRKSNFLVEHKGKSYDLIELSFDTAPGWITFKRDDGDRIYSLRQLSQQNNGRIPLQ